MLFIRIDDRHLCLVSIAKFLRWQILRKTLILGTTREAAVVATEFGGDETATRPRTRPGTRAADPAFRGRDQRRDGVRRLVTRRRRPAG